MRSARPEALLAGLVEAEVGGERLTPREILGFVQLLLIGGQETTVNLINNAILCFLEYPDELARLRSAPELLPSAIEEVLLPPGHPSSGCPGRRRGRRGGAWPGDPGRQAGPAR